MKTLLFSILLSAALTSAPSYSGNTYSQEFTVQKEGWLKLPLPVNIYQDARSDLADLRIYFSDGKEVSVPYILNDSTRSQLLSDRPLKILNPVTADGAHYYTFAIGEDQRVNEISLEFAVENFEWYVKLEGSSDQKKWFTVFDRRRILAVVTPEKRWSFTRIRFAQVNYPYLRLRIPGMADPKLQQARAFLRIDKKPLLRTCQTADRVQSNSRTQSFYLMSLQPKQTVSKLKFVFKNMPYFYRPFRVQAQADTENQSVPYFTEIFSGTLDSRSSNEFYFDTSVTGKLKIIIENNDSPPLEIQTVEAGGALHFLQVPADKPGRYLLTYGNKLLSAPNFDVAVFSDAIPENLPEAECLERKEIEKAASGVLFQPDKLWIWIVMILTAAVLGWFALKLLKEK